MTHSITFRPLLLGAALLFASAGALPVVARAQSAASIGGGHAGGVGAGSTGASNPAIFGSGPASGAPAGNGLGGNPNAIAPPAAGASPGVGVGVGTGVNNNTINPNGVPIAPPPRVRPH